MIKTNRRYIAMPDFLNLKKQNLKYLDALTYLTIRSFHNSTTNQCYPAYETIAKRAGVGRTFVAGSIKRLEESGHLKIIHSTRKHTCNQYIFGNLDRFEKVPYDIFDADLTKNEKAMLICIRQFFNEGLLHSTKSIGDFARLLGLTYNTVSKQVKSLAQKEFLKENYNPSSLVKFSITDKIDFNFDYNVKAITKPEPFKLRIAS